MLRINVTTLPPSQFNPFRTTGLPAAYTWSAIFEGLTTFDEKGQLQPHLATSWENTGPLTWVFHLRKDVTFSNGAPLTSEAVVNIVDFLKNKATNTEGVARMMFFLDKARAVDAHTVEISTTVPTPMLPRFMTQLYMVEPKYFNQVGLEAFAKAPIATGPYIVESIQPEKVRFRAFKQAWRAPKVERLEIRGLADQPTRALAVQAKQADIAMQIGPEEIAAIVAGGGRKVTWLDAQTWSYNFIGGRNPALADVRVREALNIAVDRNTIINTLLDGATIPATQPATSNVYGFNPDLPPIPFDPPRARQLLAEAGWGKGFKLVLEAVSGSGPNDDSINLTVAQYLSDIGVNVEFRPITSNDIISNSFTGNWKGDGFAIAYSFSPTLDALRALDTHSCLAAHPWYCNKAVMPLISAAQTELDTAKNLQLRRDIMAFYRKDWASLFMFQQARFAGTSAKVSGLKVVNNLISYDQITLK
ncbi:MAG: hypothetical protein JNK21_11285 [Rhodospirillaceae bacterium]|nr:hypothetical protein [Rhodospirillaceae bacterium]